MLCIDLQVGSLEGLQSEMLTTSLHSGNESGHTVPLTYDVYLGAFLDGFILCAASFMPQDEKATSFDLILSKHFECHRRTHGAVIDLTRFDVFSIEIIRVDAKMWCVCADFGSSLGHLHCV